MRIALTTLMAGAFFVAACEHSAEVIDQDPAPALDVMQESRATSAIPPQTDASVEMTVDSATDEPKIKYVSPKQNPSVSYSRLLTAPNRFAKDAESDLARKPSSVLEFAKLKPGQTVLELEAGGGYYTELMSRAVGPSGKVYMQNPAAFDAFLGDILERRVEGRLTNVEIVKSQFDDLPLPDASVDVVTWFLGPHELYFTPEGAPEGLGEVDKAYAEIVRVLKPGGHFVALDHAAAKGSPPETGGTTHRIDPAHVIASANSAGLELVAKSNLLANPDDDYEKNVFDPEVRRKTDRFLLRFMKR